MFNQSTKSQHFHIIMVHQSIKKTCIIPMVGGATFCWVASEFNIIIREASSM